jgi:mannose-6-phosphate isomerase-like protein (cupin superfamily)
VGAPSLRRPGETWEAFERRLARTERADFPAEAFGYERSLDALAPEARAVVADLLARADRAGFSVRVAETYRAPARQAFLLRTTPEFTRTATSSHADGRAVDLVIGDGRLTNAATMREWIAFRRWLLAHGGGRVRLVGAPDRTWDWPHVEVTGPAVGFRTVDELLAAARRCLGAATLSRTAPVPDCSPPGSGATVAPAPGPLAAGTPVNTPVGTPAGAITVDSAAATITAQADDSARADTSDARSQESELARIRARYAAINEQADASRAVATRFPGERGEAGTLRAYFDGEALRRVVTEYRVGAQAQFQSFYFWNDTLFFVFRSKRSTASGADRAEDRFYFVDGRLRRWVDGRRQVRLDESRARQVAADLLERAAVVADLAREARAGR